MKRQWIGAMLVAANFLIVAAVYGVLPERIPTHWGMNGEADAWGDKWPWAFLPPVVALVTWLLVSVLPRIGPRRENIDRFADTWWLVLNAMLAFFLMVTVATLGAALGWPIDVARVIIVGVGVLLAVLGNYLPRVRSNWWMGIRTPWTLENETVWRETHRVGGRVMVMAGLTAAAAALLLPSPAREFTAIGAVALSTLVPLVYSYVVWRRETGA